MTRAMRRAWIFGCGYLGLPLLERWLSAGVAVTVMTRSSEKASRLRALGAEAVVTSAGDPDPPRETPDVVAWAVGFERESPPRSTREEAWVGGLQRLGADLVRRGVTPRVLYVSTTGVYGDAEGADVDESVAPAPHTEGGRIALAAEAVARGFATDAVAIRLAGIVGPRRLLQPVEAVRRGLVLRAEPDHWLNLVHVDDAVRLIDKVARHESPPAVVNAAMQRTPTRREYYEGLARRLGGPTPRFEPSGEHVANRRIASAIRADLLTFRHEAIDTALDAMVAAEP